MNWLSEKHSDMQDVIEGPCHCYLYCVNDEKNYNEAKLGIYRLLVRMRACVYSNNERLKFCLLCDISYLPWTKEKVLCYLWGWKWAVVYILVVGSVSSIIRCYKYFLFMAFPLLWTQQVWWTRQSYIVSLMRLLETLITPRESCFRIKKAF